MISETWLRQLLASLLVVLCLADGVGASEIPIPHGTVELLADTRSVQPGRAFYAGLNFRLQPGWHIYWINPGDAGEPPRISWSLPDGISAGAVEWPAPEALPAFSDMDFGYQNQVLLLVPMAPRANLIASPAGISASVKLIVCREVCVPGKAQVALSLPVSGQGAEPNLSVHGLFTAARKQVPRSPPSAWKFKAASQKDSFRLTATLGRPTAKAFFFPLEASQIENAAPQSVQPTKSGFAMVLKKSERLLKPIHELKGVLLLGDESYSIVVPVE